MSIIVKSGGGSGTDTGIFAEYGSTDYPKSLKIVLPTIPAHTFRVESNANYSGIFTQEATSVEIKTTDIGERAFGCFFTKVPSNSKIKIDAVSMGNNAFSQIGETNLNVKIWISNKCESIHQYAFSSADNIGICYCEAESAGSGWIAGWSDYFTSVMYGVTEAEFDAL